MFFMDQPVQQRIQTFLGYEVFNNFVSEYLLALLMFLIGILIINFILKGSHLVIALK